jgi:hypothetical protein
VQNWFKGMIRQVHVAAFRNATARNETASKQAEPIFKEHRRDLSKKLRLEGSKESIKRAAVFQLNGVAVGRTCEISGLSIDCMKWDLSQKVPSAEWAQVKTHKHKIVLLMASGDRNLCPLNALATAYARGVFNDQMWEEDGMNFLFPGLAERQSSNSAEYPLTVWLRQQSQESTHGIYSNFIVDSLPKGVSASGQRVGGIDEMSTSGVSFELMLHNSGHDATRSSTLFHYIRAHTASCIPGARVLSGWPAPPYGQLGAGAKAASLDPVLGLGINKENLDVFIDTLLWLRPDFVSPELVGRGRMRPFSMAMAATLIMFYGQSYAAGEATAVTERMKDCMVDAGLASNPVDAHKVLMQWGMVTETEFITQNLPLTTCADAAGVFQVTSALESLARTLAVWKRDSTDREKALHETIVAMEAKLLVLTTKVTALGAAFSARAFKPLPRRGGGAAADGAAADGAGMGTAADGAAAGGAAAGGAGSVANDAGTVDGTAADGTGAAPGEVGDGEDVDDGAAADGASASTLQVRVVSRNVTPPRHVIICRLLVGAFW